MHKCIPYAYADRCRERIDPFRRKKPWKPLVFMGQWQQDSICILPYYGSSSTAATAASAAPWTLPRAKKVSTGHFFTSLRSAALFESNLLSPPKRKDHPSGGLLFGYVKGFERLNATRTSVAADGLTEAILYFLSASLQIENANKSLSLHL